MSPSPNHRTPTWPDRTEWAVVLGVLLVLLLVFAQVYLIYLPNAAGRVASDYSLFMPDMLVGYYWVLHNGVFTTPWFSPAQCGGVPYFPDPQVAFYALPQALTSVVSPLVALQVNVMVFAAIGFLGAYALARFSFATSRSAALLAATLFMFNSFFATRMLVGHLTFHAFMLLPLFAACLLPPPGTQRLGVAAATLRVGVAGAAIGYMVESGMFHVLPPTLLSFTMVAVLYVWRFGWRWWPATGFVFAVALGLLLSAGKLAATLSFLANFPRTDYALPGIPGLWADFWLAFRTLFFAVPDDAPNAIANTQWAEARHEWEYGVTPIPLCLMLAAAGGFLVRLRAWPGLRGRSVLLLGGLCVLLAVPVLVNWYEPSWNAVLKGLPFLGSSSNLLRWFSTYILPATIGGALALDALCAGGRAAKWRPTLAAGCITAVVAFACSADLAYYGARGTGSYDPAAIQAAYHTAARTGAVPSIDAVVVLVDPSGHLLMTAQRNDTLTRGHSQMLCYQPVFGYRLEHLPLGTLHPGPALAQSDGVFNFKNPVCYVFGKQNGCTPGGQFAAGAEADARALLDYRPYDFQRPGYAWAAGWAATVALACWVAGMAAAVAALCRPIRRAAAVASGTRPVATDRA